ncbi:MAG: DUF4013 domain-containing protein, partial [Thermomicrobium sp.]
MDIARAFTAPFRDEQWPEKGIIAALLSLVPLLGYLVVFGWALRYSKDVLLGSDSKLPTWSAWSQDLVLGLKAMLVGLIWYSPVYPIVLCSALALVPLVFDDQRLAIPSLAASLFGLLCLVPLFAALG